MMLLMLTQSFTALLPERHEPRFERDQRKHKAKNMNIYVIIAYIAYAAYYSK